MQVKIKRDPRGYYIEITKFLIFKSKYKQAVYGHYTTTNPYTLDEYTSTNIVRLRDDVVYFDDANEAWFKAQELKEYLTYGQTV